MAGWKWEKRSLRRARQLGAFKKATEIARVVTSEGGDALSAFRDTLKREDPLTLGRKALDVAAFPAREHGQPLAGSAIRAARNPSLTNFARVADRLNPVNANVRLLGSATGYGAYRQQNAEDRGVYERQRNRLPVGGQVLADIATDPLTYVGPGAVKGALRFGPSALRNSRGARVAGAILENPKRATIGGAFGAAGGAQIAANNDASPGVQLGATLAGGVLGGGLASRPTAARDSFNQGLARAQGNPLGNGMPAVGAQVFDASKADRSVPILRESPEPGKRLLFHSTKDKNFVRPDSDLSTGGAVGSSQGEGLYTATTPEKSAGRYGNRTFVIQFDGNTLDLTKPMATNVPLSAGASSWVDVQARMARELRSKGLDATARRVENAFKPNNLAAARSKAGSSNLLADLAAYDKSTGIANGYVYRAAIVNALEGSGERLPHHLLGRFGAAVKSDATQGKKASVYTQETLANAGVDALFHKSPSADGDVFIIINGSKAKVVGEGMNISGVVGRVADQSSAYDLHNAVNEAAKGYAGNAMYAPSYKSFGPTSPFSNIGRVIRLSKSTPNGVAFGTTDVPFGLPRLDPTPLTRTDHAMNAIKGTLGYVGEHPAVKPAMQWRRDVQQVVESQAQRLFTQTRPFVESAFDRHPDGRIPGILGAPTIQDIAADLPRYRPLLTPAQAGVMDRLFDEVEPLNALLEQAGIHLGQRPDIKPGGFYLPRGRADLEGADMPLPKVRGGGGRAGSKKGFEKAVKFEDSMVQGIDAGYEYAPIEEALRAHVLDVGRRTSDQHVADYFKTVRDENGELMGESPHARLMRQNGPLANRMEGLRKSLTSTQATAARVDDRVHDVIARFLAHPQAASPDFDELLRGLDQRVGVSATGAQGPNYGKDVADLRRQIAAIKMTIKGIQPDYTKALVDARNLPRNTSQIGFTQLQGTSFPDAVANAANKYLAAEQPPSGRGAILLKATAATNNLLRGLRATADVSFMGIQGVIGAASHPVDYGKALKVAFHAMATDEALGAHTLAFDARAAAGGVPTSRDWIANGLHHGGAKTEFEIAGSVPRTAKRLENMPVIAQSNRMFGYFGDTLRLELADTAYKNALKHGYDMREPRNLAGVANAANLATGWSKNAFGGDVGQLALFAPRFFQSQLELLAKLGRGGIEGHEARDMMGKYLGASVLLTIAANEATGRKVSYEDMFNPDSPNFMRFRVSGQDTSLLGPWDSLLRGVVAASKGDMTYMARTKASPVVALGWDVFSGKTFTGDDARTPSELFRHLLPFSLQDIGREGPAATGIGLTGLKTTPQTPNEQLDVIALASQGKKFYDLLPSEQKAIKDEHPDLWARAVDRKTKQGQAWEETKTTYTGQQQGDDDLLLSGGIDPREWQTRRAARRSEKHGRALELFGTDGPDPKNATLAGYFKAIEASKVNGQPNWDAVDENYTSKLPKSEQDLIANNTGLYSTPVEKLRKRLTNEYYELPQYRGYTADEARQINALHQEALNAAGGSTSTARRLRALKELGGDERIVRGVRRYFLGYLKEDRARARYKKARPEVAVFNRQGKLTPEDIAAIRAAL